jgi:hypothetical protein
MATVITCVGCNSRIRVPDTLIGKRIRCPGCGARFLVPTPRPYPQAGRPAAEEAVPRPPVRSSEAIRTDLLPPGSRSRDGFAEDSGPRTPPSPAGDDEDEDYPAPAWPEEVRAAVFGPAVGLMALGGMTILLPLLGFLLGPVLDGLSGRTGRTFETADVIGMILGGLLYLYVGLILFAGGLRMLQRRDHELATIAAILAILGCGGCCFVSLPLGIWALVVLNRPEVKDAFLIVADSA